MASGLLFLLFVGRALRVHGGGDSRLVTIAKLTALTMLSLQVVVTVGVLVVGNSIAPFGALTAAAAVPMLSALGLSRNVNRGEGADGR